MRMALLAPCAFIGLVGMAHAQQSAPVTDGAYMRRVTSAAPPQIVADATVLRRRTAPCKP